MKNLALLCILIFFTFNISAQTLKRIKREVTELYPNGNLHKRTLIKEVKNKTPDIFENYLKTTTTTYTYYPNNKLKSIEKSVEKIGDVGVNCNFVKYSLKQYDESGRLYLSEKMRCDGKKEVFKFFDHINKTETTSIIKRAKIY
ncbi:MAG: hypothetical protein H0X62_14085, partial [Bacteroidetes bacterium]|nr:hypothetical protein [Bacteroidota bacterium]